MELFLLLLVPLLIALGGFIYSAHRGDKRYRITLKEFFILIGAVVIVITVGYFVSRLSSLADKEVWNGRIAKKEKEKVICEHGYPCNPHSCMCNDKGNCSTCWDTCYEHSYDWDWALYTSNNERVGIDRIDRRGANEPPRFNGAKIGDPTALPHWYKNYIKANPWSILRKQGLTEKFKDFIPAYPAKVYDYHYVDKFVAVKISLKEAGRWNKNLMELNADLGKKKEVNVIFVAVPLADSSYVHALEEAWLGGKQNDLVVIFGVPEYPKISWVRVMSWTRAEELKIYLRDELQDIGDLEKREEIIAKVKELTDKHFVRTKMSEFEYLAAGVRPPAWAIIALFIIGVGISIGLSIYFWRDDPFSSRNYY